MEGKRRKKLFIIGGVRVDDVLDVLDSRIRAAENPSCRKRKKKKSRARVKVDGSRRAFRALNPPVHS